MIIIEVCKKVISMLKINLKTMVKPPIDKAGKTVRALTLSAAALIPVGCADVYVHSPVAPSSQKALSSIRSAADTVFGDFIGNIYIKDGDNYNVMSLANKKLALSQFSFTPIEGAIKGFHSDSAKINSPSTKKYYLGFDYMKTIGSIFTEAKNGNVAMTDTSSNTVRRWMNAVMDKNMYVQSLQDPSKVSCVRLAKTTSKVQSSKSFLNDAIPKDGTNLTNMVPRDSVTQNYIDNKIDLSKERAVFEFCKDSSGADVDAQANKIMYTL